MGPRAPASETSGIAFAAPAIVQPGDSRDRAASVVPTKDLIGRHVHSQDGHHLGDVVRLAVDTSSWQISMIAVRLRRSLLESLGLEKPWLGSQIVWIHAHELSPGRTLVLDRALADLHDRFADDEQAGDLDDASAHAPPA